MGSSARKKKQKKQDFQKPKLKVGKAKAKPANFTDTSFKSKTIVINQQSLAVDGVDAVEQFKHNLSLAASSRSEKQRRDALAFLTSQVSGNLTSLPVATSSVSRPLLPLISDTSAPVRAQLLKLFRALPSAAFRTDAEKPLMYIRAGMTHLSAEIQDDALNMLEWVLGIAGDEVVSCPGGWMKTLNCFSAILGWRPTDASSSLGSKGWSSVSHVTLSTSMGAHSRARKMDVLARFLQIGFKPECPAPNSARAYWGNLYQMPKTKHAFAHLNLFGAARDDDGEMYPDRTSRQRVFHERWFQPFSLYVEKALREEGPVGRSATTLKRILTDDMESLGTSYS